MIQNLEQHSSEQITVSINQNGNLIASYTISLSNYSNVIQTCESIILTTLLNNQQKAQEEELEISSEKKNLLHKLTHYQLHYQDIKQNLHLQKNQYEIKINILNQEILHLNEIIQQKNNSLQQHFLHRDVEKKKNYHQQEHEFKVQKVNKLPPLQKMRNNAFYQLPTLKKNQFNHKRKKSQSFSFRINLDSNRFQG